MVRVCAAAVVLAVWRLAIRGLSTLPIRLAALLRRSTANQTLRWWRRARIGRDRRRPSVAVPVSEESLSAARIGIPPRVRTHGQSLCGKGGYATASETKIRSSAVHRSRWHLLGIMLGLAGLTVDLQVL